MNVLDGHVDCGYLDLLIELVAAIYQLFIKFVFMKKECSVDRIFTQYRKIIQDD